MSAPDKHSIALEFLHHARAGDRREAERLCTPDARHHNPFFPAGMAALLDGIVAAAKATTDHSIDVKHVLAYGDYAAVHSYVPRPGEPGIAVVHLFRFEGDRIAELWDVGQMIPTDMKNADGMF